MAVITRKRGLFTLVELLIVIAVIAILASLFLPALRKARESAKGSMCQSNIRQLGICFNNYTSDYDGYLPSNERTLYVEFANGDVWAANVCWYQAQIGPYLQLNKNDKSIGYCPSSFSVDENTTLYYSTLSYGFNYRFGYAKFTQISKSSERILLIDASYPTPPGSLSAWATWDRVIPRHNAGCNVGMLDGHVEWKKWLEVNHESELWQKD